jgi:hypothetical protein
VGNEGQEDGLELLRCAGSPLVPWLCCPLRHWEGARMGGGMGDREWERKREGSGGN